MRLVYPNLSETPERRNRDSTFTSACWSALYVALVASSALWIVGALWCAIVAPAFSWYATGLFVAMGAICGLLARLIR